MPHRIITTTETLAARCAEWAQAPVLAIDTEFVRERTYYPILCLIQVASSEGMWAIDPLAEGIDLAPFFAVLANPSVLKLFHAARQDLEIFYQLTHTLPQPMFDTQIGAQFIGMGESVGYGEMVRKLLGITLDKAMRYTDWQKRPLSPEQLEYALADVTHLLEAYGKMEAMLQERNLLAAAQEETLPQLDPALYDPPYEDAWQRIRHGQLTSKQLAALRALAALRERIAQSRNLPRGFIIKDEALVKLASTLPRSEEDLTNLRGMPPIGRTTYKPLIAAINEALASAPESWPKLPKRRATSADPAVELLSMLLQVVCAHTQILPRLVASREEMEALAAGNRDVRPMQDWRYDLFGKHAEAFLAGRLSLRFNPEARELVMEE